MESILRKDMDKLVRDTTSVKDELEVLEQDHRTWTRSREHEDLMDILEGVKRLEFDVSVMVGDCARLRESKKDDGIKGDLHEAFKNLNTLFAHLKKAREEIDRSYVKAGELEKLEIDWQRFKKTVVQIQEDLER